MAKAEWTDGLGIEKAEAKPEFPSQHFKQRIAELAFEFGEAMSASTGAMPYREVFDALRRLPHLLDDIAKREAWLNEARVEAVRGNAHEGRP